MHLEAAQHDHLGDRPNQEDCMAIAPMLNSNGQFLFLADGAGGANAGEVASQTVIKTALKQSQTFDFKSHNLIDHLVEITELSNDAIRAATHENNDYQGMATTFIGAAITDATLQWISIGDSHLYVFREKKLVKLNQEHTLAMQMIASGIFEKDEIQPLRNTNTLTSALDGRELIELVDISEEPYLLRNDDLVLLASDGLDTLTQMQIEEVLGDQKNTPSEMIARKLIKSVIAVGKNRQDNVSLQIAKVTGIQTAQPQPAQKKIAHTADDKVANEKEESRAADVDNKNSDRHPQFLEIQKH